jgi:hypothetical protein
VREVARADDDQEIEHAREERAPDGADHDFASRGGPRIVDVSISPRQRAE